MESAIPAIVSLQDLLCEELVQAVEQRDVLPTSIGRRDGKRQHLERSERGRSLRANKALELAPKLPWDEGESVERPKHERLRLPAK